MSQTCRALGSDALALVDATAGNETVSLTRMASGRTVTVRRIDSSVNTVTVVVTSGLYLDGVLNGTTTVTTNAQKQFTATDSGFESFGGGPVVSVDADGSLVVDGTTVELGTDSDISGKLTAASNLSDLANAGTARTNLGLGTAATMTPATIAADAALKGTYVQVTEAPLNILRYGAVGDYNTNNNTALQNALDAVPSGGGEVFIPRGQYVYNAPLVPKARTKMIGEGDSSRLVSTHTGSSITFIHPGGVDTADYFIGRDFTLTNTNASNVGGGIEIVSGQQFDFHRVTVVGHKFGALLDGAQIAKFTTCIFDQQLALGASAWLTSGPDRTAGVVAAGTNRITFSGCDFNCEATGSLGIVDDGGWAHEYIGGNFNFGSTQIRMAGTSAAHIEGGEFENASAQNFLVAATKWLGGATSRNVALTIKSSVMSAGSEPTPNAVAVQANSIYALTLIGNSFFTTAPSVTGAVNIDTLVSLGNFQNGSGALYDGNAVNHIQMDRGTIKSMVAPSAGAGFTRPSLTGLPAGVQFWDNNLGKPVWSDGAGNWRDATNAIMA